MIPNVVVFVLGAAWLQQQSELPGVLWVYALVPAVLGWWLLPPATSPRQAFVRRLCGALLCFAGGVLWAALVAHVKLADDLPEE